MINFSKMTDIESVNENEDATCIYCNFLYIILCLKTNDYWIQCQMCSK